VGTAAIAARVGLPRAATTRRAAARTLAFDELGGPLVAVCGLAGGAGTSTLALLLCREVAAASAAPTLLTEADARRAGLAILAGCATPRPLVVLAHEMAEERTPTDTFVELAPGLRLIAAKPHAPPTTGCEALGALLGQARDAHGLVVVDHGMSWSMDSPVLALATHIVWAIPATPLGVEAAQARLDVAPPAGRWREVLAATAITSKPRVSVRAVRKLARRRCEQLVLVGYDEALARGRHTTSETTLGAISALAATLRRRP
jgi:cellulose biosynthesis protein BcsQ